MLGFLVKKAFFDTWDNLFRVLLLNIGFYAPVALLVYAPLITPVLPLTILLQIVALGLFCVYTGGASAVASAIADYQSPDFAMFWQAIQDTYPTTLLFALVNSVYFVILSVAFRVYAVVDQQLLGFLGQVILLWVTVGWVLAAQFFFPIQSRLERNPRKMVRKMLLLFFDNTGFMIFLACGALVVVAASVFTGGILPGLGAVLVWHNVALKLRLYKYDHLDRHPESKRKEDTLGRAAGGRPGSGRKAHPARNDLPVEGIVPLPGNGALPAITRCAGAGLPLPPPRREFSTPEFLRNIPSPSIAFMSRCNARFELRVLLDTNA